MAPTANAVPLHLVVALDTSEFEAMRFEFRIGGYFNALEREVARGAVTVLITDVIDREVKRRILQRVDESVPALNKAAVAVASLKPSVAKAIRAFDPKKATATLTAEYEAFKRRVHVQALEVDAVKPSRVMELYFAQKPPFGPGKTKEFPDAFSVERFRAWSKENGDQQVNVVSRDNDLKHACDGEFLVHAERVNAALAKLYRNKKISRSAIALTKRKLAAVRKVLGSEFAGLGHYLDDMDSEISDVVIEGVQIDTESLQVIHAGESEAVVEGRAEISYRATASVADYDESPHDEGEYVFLLYDDVVFTGRRDVEFTVTVAVEGELATKTTAVELEDNAEVEISLSDENVKIVSRERADED